MVHTLHPFSSNNKIRQLPMKDMHGYVLTYYIENTQFYGNLYGKHPGSLLAPFPH